MFGLSIDAIVGFNVVGGVEGIGGVESVLVAEGLHLIKYIDDISMLLYTI